MEIEGTLVVAVTVWIPSVSFPVKNRKAERKKASVLGLSVALLFPLFIPVHFPSGSFRDPVVLWALFSSLQNRASA